VGAFMTINVSLYDVEKN